MAWSICCDLLDVKTINQFAKIERLKNAANAAFFNTKVVLIVGKMLVD